MFIVGMLRSANKAAAACICLLFQVAAVAQVDVFKNFLTLHG